MAFNFGLIDHLVVLMLENRSFDHMLGSLDLEDPTRGVEGVAAALHAINVAGTVDVNPDLDPAKGRYLPHQLVANPESWPPITSNGISLSNRRSRFYPDPPHERDLVQVQLALDATTGTFKMSGFVKAYQQAYANHTFLVDNPSVQPLGQVTHGLSQVPYPGDVLGYYTRAELPVLYFLADQGVVCDHWFCSVPASTFPNRLYAMCGSSGGVDRTDGKPNFALNLQCIFDHLDDRDWVIYSAPLGAVTGLAADIVLGGAAAGLGPPIPGCTPMFLQDWEHKKNVKRHWQDLGDLSGFVKAAEGGKLPKVTWIEPRDADLGDIEDPNDDHPPTPIEAGQRLMRAVYNALASNKESWQRTVLVITYDEHGGFYDHVPPPTIPASALSENDKQLGFATFGPRVPAIVISPLAVQPGQGSKLSTQMEHASILRFICDWRGINPKDVSPRVAGTESFAGALIRIPPDNEDYPLAPDVPDVTTTAGSRAHHYAALRAAVQNLYVDAKQNAG
jgi:phospholipase C